MAKPKTSHEKQEINRILESIDAGLQASDSATGAPDPALKGLMEEMAQLSPDLVATMITDRLTSGLVPDPIFWLQILSMAPSERVPNLLGRIARERNVPDSVRIAAHRLARLDEQDHERQQRRFLKTLRDPVAALVEVIERARMIWFADVEELSDAIELLLLLEPEQQAEVLVHVEEEPDEARIWLFHELLQCDDESLQRLALNALDRIGSPLSIGALDRFVRLWPDSSLVDEARATAERLRRDAAAEADKIGRTLPPVALCALSAVDAAGTQTAFVIRWITEETCLLINHALSDLNGIVSATAVGPVPKETVSALLEEFEETGIELVDVDLSAVRGAIAQYLEINVEDRISLPLGYELCEPLLHDSFPQRDDEPITQPVLAEGKDAGRGNVVRKAGALLDHPLFVTWTFEPLQLVPTLLAIAAPGDEVTALPYPTLLESALSLGMDETYRERLHRQAWLLDKSGATRDRDLALAVAATLADPEPSVLARQPFWQTMVDRAVESLADEMEET